MSVKEVVIRLLAQKKRIKTSDIVGVYKNKISRQYANRILGQLIKEGKVAKIGTTINAQYVLSKDREHFEQLQDGFRKRFKIKSLKEHEVLDTINHRLTFIVKASENVRSIFDYAFSEMLNNAIDHSKSSFVEVEVRKSGQNLVFVINDFGIGVFRNVMKERALNSELEAIQDLLKGKTTTAPLAHSGEGIFFTSKIADEFVLESFDYKLRIDNRIKDVFVEKPKPIKRGTRVIFTLALDSGKHLGETFSSFSSDMGEPNFDKTQILVKLYTLGTIYVSRSQARRILSGLDKFQHIVLDYRHVPTIGQAFADEIYRVFQLKQPNIKIESIGANEAVQFMIDRVERPMDIKS